jgi:hypothetical protein
MKGRRVVRKVKHRTIVVYAIAVFHIAKEIIGLIADAISLIGN